MSKWTYTFILTNIFNVIIIIFCFNITETKAQDPHFSQFYASPLTLNPAMTGAIPGYARVAANFRSQWSAVSTPFITSSAAADIKLLLSNPDAYDKHHYLGFGILAMNDQSNNGALKANYFTLSLAPNIQLKRSENLRLGLGFQMTFANRTLDYSKLTFGQQFTPYGYDINLPTGESKGGFSLNYIDYHTGIMLSGKDDEGTNMWYIGSSLYHIGRPIGSLSGKDTDRIQRRITVNGMFNSKLENGDRLYLSGLYMKSGFMEEYMAGAVYSFNIDDVSEDETIGRSFQAGCWYRLRDAIIPYLGLQLRSYHVSLSYDANISKLSTASNFKGGFELTMTYNFLDNENASLIHRSLCPTPPHKNYIHWYGY